MTGSTVWRCALLVLISVAAAAAAASAAGGERPATVSPGGSTGVSIAPSCPTFSWGEVSSAEAYDLVVYRVGAGRDDVVAVLAERLPGAVGTWTPPLERCLESGSLYAWTVGALSRYAEAAWSEPRLFRVVAAAHEARLEAAVELVRSYLEDRDASSRGLDVGQESARGSDDPVVPGSGYPTSSGPAATVMSVDGNVDAVAFSGDGAGLTGLDPEAISPGTAAIDISGSAGSAPIVGWERVSFDLPCSDSSICFVLVHCPSGSNILGGGLDLPDEGDHQKRADVSLNRSFPLSGSAWQVEASNRSGVAVNYRVWAICATTTLTASPDGASGGGGGSRPL